jgi:peptidyl-prolyl cis-trans isomerase C
MKRTSLSLSLITLASVFTLASASAADKDAKPAASTNPNKPIATVNGKVIPANRAEILLANQIAQGQARTPELESAVREELIRREVLAQEAKKQGVDKKAEVKSQIELAQQGVLIGAFLNDYARSVKIDDAEVAKEYDKIKGNLGDQEYKARHILVEKEDDAKAIIEKLKKGEKFEDLAKASLDPGSKERGGELGWANKSSYVPEFSSAMQQLEKGKYTEAPVKSQFGWHIIQLDDTRELKGPSFDDVKPQIVQRMRQAAVEKLINDLRSKAKVD